MARHGIRRLSAAGSKPWTATPCSVGPFISSRRCSFVLPDPGAARGGITRTGLSILFVGTALCIELARISLASPARPPVVRRAAGVGVRPRLLGLTFGLFVIRNPSIVVPVFLGMAWIDPFAALCRRRGWNRILPTAAYLGLFLGTELACNRSPSRTRSCLPWRHRDRRDPRRAKFKDFDDDLLLQIGPMIVLYILLAWVGTGRRPSSGLQLP